MAVPQITIEQSNPAVDISGRERPDVWLFDIRATYVDGTEKQVTAVRDFNSYRVVNGAIADFKPLIKDAAVKIFMAALGKPNSGSLPSNVSSVVFRFSAITTSGVLHVAGASDQVPSIESDNLAVVKAKLNADAEFVLFFNLIRI